MEQRAVLSSIGKHGGGISTVNPSPHLNRELAMSELLPSRENLRIALDLDGELFQVRSPLLAAVLDAFASGELKTDAEHREAIDYEAAANVIALHSFDREWTQLASDTKASLLASAREIVDVALEIEAAT
jgi:hypothetical protein